MVVEGEGRGGRFNLAPSPQAGQAVWASKARGGDDPLLLAHSFLWWRSSPLQYVLSVLSARGGSFRMKTAREDDDPQSSRSQGRRARLHI